MSIYSSHHFTNNLSQQRSKADPFKNVFFPMTDPWDCNMYLHIPQKSTIHVGKYTSPMDPSWDRLYYVYIFLPGLFSRSKPKKNTSTFPHARFEVVMKHISHDGSMGRKAYFTYINLGKLLPKCSM